MSVVFGVGKRTLAQHEKHLLGFAGALCFSNNVTIRLAASSAPSDATEFDTRRGISVSSGG